MDHNETTGRHRRHRNNTITRATLDEARRPGLVQRHLTKLRHLTAGSHPTQALPASTPTSTPEKPPHTTNPAASPPTTAITTPPPPAEHPQTHTTEAA